MPPLTPPPPRLPNWQVPLADYIAAAVADPDQFGAMPCARFAAGAVETMTGADLHGPFGVYASAREAAQALADHGAGTLHCTLRALFGPARPPAAARPGDVVMRRHGLGIMLTHGAAFIADGALIVLRRSALDHAWRVA